MSSLLEILWHLFRTRLTKITGKPDFCDAFSSQTRTHCQCSFGLLPSRQRCLGHAVLVLGADDYQARAGVAWENPVNPGAQPVFPPGATGLQIAAITANFERQQKEWSTFTLVGRLLKQQLIEAIDETYIKSLDDPIFGYANVTVLPTA
jgi:hypothetical protein